MSDCLQGERVVGVATKLLEEGEHTMAVTKIDT